MSARPLAIVGVRQPFGEKYRLRESAASGKTEKIFVRGRRHVCRA